eukprot:PITA_32460
MQKNDTISQYLSRFTQVRGELGGVGVNVAEDDVVSLSLLALPKSWHSYQNSMNGRERLLNWERLWSDLVQKEFRRNNHDGTSSKAEDEENFALVGKGKKGKGKKTQSKPESSQNNGKKKDMSKIKCFHCHKFGHCATKCPHKKSTKKPSGGGAGEALASQFKLDFTLIACMVSTVMGSVWYLDYGASFHMTRCNEFFSSLEEKDLQMLIEMSDDGRYSVIGIAVLEDHNYDVIFSKGKAFLRHIATRQVKQIRVRVKNLYKLEVGDCTTLSSKAEKVQSHDVGELWHSRLDHLHHGALKIMQQITTSLPKDSLDQQDVCKGCTLGKYVKSIPSLREQSTCNLGANPL